MAILANDMVFLSVDDARMIFEEAGKYFGEGVQFSLQLSEVYRHSFEKEHGIPESKIHWESMSPSTVVFRAEMYLVNLDELRRFSNEIVRGFGYRYANRLVRIKSGTVEIDLIRVSSLSEDFLIHFVFERLGRLLVREAENE